MELTQAFDVLLEHYGDHSSAARALLYTPRRYRGLRAKPEDIAERVARNIVAHAEALPGPSQGGQDTQLTNPTRTQ